MTTMLGRNLRNCTVPSQTNCIQFLPLVMASRKLVWHSMFAFKLCGSEKEARHYCVYGGILFFIASQGKQEGIYASCIFSSWPTQQQLISLRLLAAVMRKGLWYICRAFPHRVAVHQRVIKPTCSIPHRSI